MNRELLETPFRPDQIKHRKGNFGSTLAYVEAHAVIQRLNDALDSAWSFEVISHDILKDEVLVLGRLTVGSVFKTQFGTSTITRNKTTGEFISLGDDLKAAATDALKKAATLLGVGIALYGGGQKLSQSPVNGNQIPPPQNGNHSQPYQPQHNYPTQPYPNNTPNGGTPYNDSHPGFNQNSQGNNRISSKQLAYLHSIAKDKAITRQELNQIAVQKFNTQVDFLTKRDASLFIEELTAQQTNSNAA